MYRDINKHFITENVDTGLRVVRTFSKTKELKAGDLGIIVDVNSKGEVLIQWDKHDTVKPV